MKVILEAQHAVGSPELRGIGVYALNLIDRLLARGNYDYGLTYFDFNAERGNLQRVQQHFGRHKPAVFGCNNIDYRALIRDDNALGDSFYEDVTGTDGGLYHFMEPVAIPTRLRGRMVVTVHDVTWESCPESLSQYALETHRLATRRINTLKPHIIADSESARREILRYMDVPPESIDVVHLSCDEENLYPDRAEVSHLVQGEYFLFVGCAYEKKKNVARIIEAFNRVAEKHSGVKFVAAGKAPTADNTELMEVINASPYRDRLVFTGYISDDEKRRLYSNAVSLVFPSLAEGFGIPVLEAMACGCPVITADNTSLPEVGGDAALYVNALDTEQLSYQMERVLLSDTLREDLIACGFLQKQRFSWDNTARQVEEVYKKVMLK